MDGFDATSCNARRTCVAAFCVVTPFARVCWWLYRIHPALIRPLNHAWVKTVREHRREP